jgi:uncharacterized damage-inducible protein DinB
MERREPRLMSNEHAMVEEFLDYQRATFLCKIAGLTKAQLAQPLSPSPLTLAGLTKHLAYVEDSWFHIRFLGHAVPGQWADAPWSDDPDWEFHSAPDDEPSELIELYESACARSRLAFASAASLEAESVEVDRKTGGKFSLRWIMLHLIEETARHNGHADLLREAIDGATGE